MGQHEPAGAPGRFGSTGQPPDDVWGPQAPLHVTGLHEPIVAEVMPFGDAVTTATPAALSNCPDRGLRGSGKTHLLGQVREQVHAAGGYAP